MADVPGMLTLDALVARAGDGSIDTVLVVFADLYGRPMGKRFDVGFFLDGVVSDGAHACDYLFTVDVGMNPVPGYAFANWERGYGDVHLLPDLATLRVASWLDKTALVQCDVAAREGPSLLDIAPRSILKAQVERATELGFSVKAASELEFFLYRTSYKEAAATGYRELPAAGWYIEDYHVLQGARVEDYVGAARRHLRDSGVPVETSKGEWGLGQHELNVRYTDVLAMADRHAVFKQCLKELAEAMGCAVTFMAKPDAAQAGSSCHIHMSLWQGDTPAFPGSGDLSGVACTDVFRWFLAGWMEHAPELMVFYAPTVNAYKRFQAASWAPTKLAWSVDNRTAGFRIVGTGSSLRIESRLAGADCNPYLAFAAALASGLDGVARRLEPPAAHQGDVYSATDLPDVPASLGEAVELFAASPFVATTFGQDVVDHYARFYRTEQQAYDAAVTDWERTRYFEQI